MSGLVDGVNENIQVKNGQEKYDVKLGIREWKRYPEYKDSGVEWIGEIPEGWEVKPLKFASELNPEALPENTDPDYILKYIDIGNVSLGTLVSEPTEMKFCNSPSRARKIVKNGDIIISTVRTYLKAILLIRNPDPNLIVSTGFAVIRSSLFNNPKYLYYAVRSTNFIEAVMAHSEGIGYPAINTLVLGKLPILIPSSIEQQAIVHFLDRETSKIDTLIEKKQLLIELLEEKRSALIRHAVTKGLDPHVKTKDLEVKWIGKIPEAWEVKRLRFVCHLNPNKSEVTTQSLELEVTFLPMELISECGNISLDETKKIREVKDGYTYFKENDVVVAKITPCFENGKGALCSNLLNGIGFGTTELHVIRSSKTSSSKFIFYITKSDPFRKLGTAAMTGSAGQKRVPEEFIKNFKIGVPPLEEQTKIVNFLDRETEKIDTFINKISAQIEKLKEYRTALISAAVTGKIDVREEVA